MTYYRTHKAYLEASKREWLREVNRTDDRITEAGRDSARKLLSRTLRELEFGDVETEKGVE